MILRLCKPLVYSMCVCLCVCVCVCVCNIDSINFPTPPPNYSNFPINNIWKKFQAPYTPTPPMIRCSGVLVIARCRVHCRKYFHILRRILRPF